MKAGKLLSDLRNEQNSILAYIQEEALLSVQKANVSGWSVGMHVDHLQKVNLLILQEIAAGRREQEAPQITALGWLCLRIGFIPRGRGKAPSAVLPTLLPALELLEGHQQIVSLLDDLSVAPGKWSDSQALRVHPFFGLLSASQWLRFLAVHSRHHRKIVVDILGSH